MGRRGKVFLLTVLASALAPSVRSVASAPPSLAVVLERLREEHDVPALGAVSLRAGQIVELAVAGTRRRDHAASVQTRHFWHLGSCTKAMTATLVARLVEKGTLRWDTTIGEALPDLRDRIRPEYRDVTVEQLLQHRGGVAGESVLGTELWRRAWRGEGTRVEQRRRFVIDVLSLPPEVPVAEFLYSNQGYAVAGHVCEHASGVPFERLMQRELFGPLDMRHAGFGAPGARAAGHPVGHEADGTPADPKLDNPPVITPAGRVHAPLEDWARFVSAHLDGAAGRSDLLDAATFRRLHTPAAGPGRRYALGWGVAERRWGGSVLNHAGSNTMWYCVVWLAPERDVAFLATCNQGGERGEKACDAVVSMLIERATRAVPRDPPSPPPTPAGLGSGRPDPP